MFALMQEIAIYLALSAFLGLLLGYLIWGWRRRELIAAARAEGAAAVRTSVDGDAGARAQLKSARSEIASLQRQVEELRTSQSPEAVPDALDAAEANGPQVSQMHRDGGPVAREVKNLALASTGMEEPQETSYRGIRRARATTNTRRAERHEPACDAARRETDQHR